jgi:hypothetical protein
MRLRGVVALAVGLLAPLTLNAQSVPGADAGKVTLGGYGEIHYINASGPNTPGRATLKRFVLYVAAGLSERIALRSEVEIEDARVEAGHAVGELAVEQLFLDYRVSDAFTLRTGLLLPPVGIINETHEPTTFNGVARPDFDHDVIPTTWRELGLGTAGQVPGVEGMQYRVYLLNGLRAERFNAAEGIREGRQEGQEASFANPSLTGRVEWARPGLKLGGSFWYGGSANQNPAIGTGTFAAPVTLLSADARYDIGVFAFRGVFANVTIADAELINAAYGAGIGRRITGGYVEGAANVLRPIVPASNQQLYTFVRYENFDTHAAVPAGVTRDGSLARRITTFGLTYKPVGNVAFKGDYQLRRNRAHAAEGEVFSLGVGYQF